MRQKVIFGTIDLDEVVRQEDARMAREKALGTKQPKTEPVKPIDNPESYILLPGRTHGTYSYPDMLVSVEKKYFGKTWSQCQDELHSEGRVMLTPRQFVDFLYFLRFGGNVHDAAGQLVPKVRLSGLYNGITALGGTRGEWLDAEFDGVGGATPADMITYHTTSNICCTERLTDPIRTLVVDVEVGFSEWLQTAAMHGLPPSAVRGWIGDNTERLTLTYRPPLKGGVTYFLTESLSHNLNCQVRKDAIIPGIGVRPAMVR